MERIYKYMYSIFMYGFVHVYKKKRRNKDSEGDKVNKDSTTTLTYDHIDVLVFI
jgi:hypothetical protein